MSRCLRDEEAGSSSLPTPTRSEGTWFTPGSLRAGERALGRQLYPQLAENWLLIADRGFYDWPDWCTAADTGAALPWRFKSDIRLPVLEILPSTSLTRSRPTSPAART